ncbi:MAG TPA: MFS transporter [Phycisphaerae bacterium]|nr:MFS transporter [Phycisphaerae bacterium]
MSATDGTTQDAPGPPRRGGLDLGHMLRALRHRNYVLFFGGQGLSLIGTWMQLAALQWLVFRITGRNSAPGELAFYSMVPTLVLFPIAGVLGDRFNRRVMVIILQSLAAIQALVLALVAYNGHVKFWHVVGLGVFAGVVRSFEIPIRQAFVVEMLEDRRDLPGAIALNSFLFNGAFIVGPSLAGLVIYLSGGNEAPCFLINGISFVTVIFALLAMRVKPRATGPAKISPVRSFLDGLRYTAAHMPIRRAIMMVAFMALVAMQYTTLMPVVAKVVLHGDERTQGYLLSAVGAGAVVGALILACQRGPEALHRLMPLGATIFGIGLVAFSFSRALWVSVGILVLAGVGRMILMASANTYVQTLVDDDKRTRVMAFYALAMMGMAPVGSLMLGTIANTPLGAPGSILLAGGASVLGAILFVGRLPAVREPIRALARPDEPESASAAS